MLLLSAHFVGTFGNGDFPSRMFFCLKMGKEFQLFLACISLGGGRVRTSQIQQGKVCLPIVTPSLFPVGDTSSIRSMVYWPCWFRGGLCDTKHNIVPTHFPKELWESDWVLTITYCDIKIISSVQLHCSYKYQ